MTESTTADGVLIALRRIVRAIDLHSRTLMQRHGLTGPQLLVMRQLIDVPEQSVGVIADRISLSQATITGIVDRLEARRLIERRRDEADKRRVLVKLTDEGRRVADAAGPLLQEHFLERFAALADWEQSLILASLQRVVAMMEAQQIDASPVFATGPLDQEIAPMESAAPSDQ